MIYKIEINAKDRLSCLQRMKVESVKIVIMSGLLLGISQVEHRDVLWERIFLLKTLNILQRIRPVNYVMDGTLSIWGKLHWLM